MKEFFLPTAKNNYQPKLLSRFALYSYLFIFLFTNIGFSFLIPAKVSAAINIDQIYTYQNQEREKRGLPDLSINSKLVESATAKAQAMLSSDCWSHYCPDGKSPWDFFDAAGYDYIYAGENLAEGFDDTEKLMQAWMNSPTHRANIINENFTEVGIGYATGKYQNEDNNTIIVVHFGSRISVDNTQNTIKPITDTNIVKFTTPLDNEYFNVKKIHIDGTAPSNSTVLFNLNGKFIGQIQSVGTSFNYDYSKELDDGEYRLYAEAYNDTNILLGASKTITFNIDTIIPVPDTLKFQVTSVITNGSKRNITLNYTDDAIYKLTEKDLNLSSERQTNGTINLELDWDYVDNHSSLVFIIADYAGNTAEVEIPGSTLLSLAQSKLDQIKTRSTSASIFSSAGLENIKLTVNWGFVSFLTTLFGIDFFFLSKTGLTNIQRSKSHLNMVIYIILLLILILGVTSGNILTGTAK